MLAVNVCIIKKVDCSLTAETEMLVKHQSRYRSTVILVSALKDPTRYLNKVSQVILG